MFSWDKVLKKSSSPVLQHNRERRAKSAWLSKTTHCVCVCVCVCTCVPLCKQFQWNQVV